jgi:predicted transcriptional regulator
MIQQLEDELRLLERHLTILRLVFENEPIGIVALSNETGYPHHKVRYSLRVLEGEDLIDPTKQGAVTTDGAAEFVETAPDRIDGIVAKLEALTADPPTVER